jgi:hypothetical protein
MIQRTLLFVYRSNVRVGCDGGEQNTCRRWCALLESCCVLTATRGQAEQAAVSPKETDIRDR